MVINSQKVKDFLPPKRFLITFAETKLTVQNKGKPRSSLKKISLEELCVFFTQTESFNFFSSIAIRCMCPPARETERERKGEKETVRNQPQGRQSHCIPFSEMLGTHAHVSRIQTAQPATWKPATITSTSSAGPCRMNLYSILSKND